MERELLFHEPLDKEYLKKDCFSILLEIFKSGPDKISKMKWNDVGTGKIYYWEINQQDPKNPENMVESLVCLHVKNEKIDIPIFLEVCSESVEQAKWIKLYIEKAIDDRIEKNLVRDIYLKEREYQKRIFGNQKGNEAMNVSSFLTFLQSYIDKASKSYCEKWNNNLPDWLIQCREFSLQKTAPVKTYSYLIKILALTGAALEFFTDINVNEWRNEEPNTKWSKGEIEND